MGPEQAVFVPRGVANGYQALEADTGYSYLVNDHWSPEARASYTYVNLADPALERTPRFSARERRRFEAAWRRFWERRGMRPPGEW